MYILETRHLSLKKLKPYTFVKIKGDDSKTRTEKITVPDVTISTLYSKSVWVVGILSKKDS